MKKLFAAIERESSFEYRVTELVNAMKENGLEWTMDWMEFSRQMVPKLESNETLEEYDNWRVANGAISLIRRFKRVGRDHLMNALVTQRQIDVIAFDRYTDWCISK